MAENVTWFKIRSWHIVRTPTRVSDNYRSYCGKQGGPEVEDRDLTEKTCEKCLQLAGPR